MLPAPPPGLNVYPNLKPHICLCALARGDVNVQHQHMGENTATAFGFVAPAVMRISRY